MRGCRRQHVILPLLLAWSAMTATAREEATPADRALVDQVMHRLLAVAEPVAGFAWPPTFKVVPVIDGDEVSACAHNASKDDQARPEIDVTDGLLLQVVDGNADRLAFVLGHELGHIVLKHGSFRAPTPVKTDVKTDVVKHVFSREEEIAADKKGMELTLAAGYSKKGALGAIRRFIDLDLEYSSFEGLGVGHPSWKDRIALLDKEQAPLWHAMAAFHDGTYFLITEQYGSAERCFRAVTREFPACHEAWANLGYALLMRYCDGLEVDDLRRFDLGQLAVGGFYRRPGTLEAQVRGIDEELWWDAVGALREALRLKPDSVVIKANLGVAYLVRPAGRDVGQAARYLQEAAEAVESDPANAGLNDLEKVNLRAAVLLNAGVADLAGGRSDVGARRLDRVAALDSQFSGDRPERPRASGLVAALHYNRALLLAASPEAEKRRAAVGQFERYLRSASPASAWWPLAYERYAKLCRELLLEAKSEKELKDQIQTDLRPLTAVQLRSGTQVTLSEPMGEVTDRLGGGQAVPVVPGTNLRRLSYPDQGIDLLVTDRVLAIRLRGPGAPTLPLRSTGLGTTATELRVGMAKRELDQLLKDLDYSFAGLDDPEVLYRFYPKLGLAVQVRSGRVEELVVVRVPRRESSAKW